MSFEGYPRQEEATPSVEEIKEEVSQEVKRAFDEELASLKEVMAERPVIYTKGAEFAARTESEKIWCVAQMYEYAAYKVLSEIQEENGAKSREEVTRADVEKERVAGTVRNYYQAQTTLAEKYLQMVEFSGFNKKELDDFRDEAAHLHSESY